MIRPTSLRIAALCGAACALSLAACEKPKIHVYTISKRAPEAPPPPNEKPLQLSDAQAKPSGNMARKPTAPKAARPQLDYQLPAGWQDMGPSEFSLVNFRIPTPKGDAMVNITPLMGMSGKDTMIVNMWRQQVDQPALDDAAAAAGLTKVDIGGEEGKLFEVTGQRDKETLQIITAFLHRPDGSWFYKLQGSSEAVAAQKEAFLDFLKTVKIKAPAETADATAAPPPSAPAPAPAPTSEPASGAAAVHLMAPEGWKEQSPGQMQVAKFSVEKEGGKADISVSVFGSDTGGTLSNVNRWRRQMGLADVDEAGLAECVTTLGGSPIDGAPGPVLADISKENRRLLGAIVPREGQWWFYKMVGDAPAVNAEHDTFVQFVKSQP